MNPHSLDSSIQNILSILYPPFEATAPTLLSQVFRLIESTYQGDGLRCLLDFLIPAKRILESIQQDACAAYSDKLFRHEGWPLCLHEKVVIQLSALNPLLLRPGDFYLQVEPFRDQSARIVLKCLSRDLSHVDDIPIPEISYPCIFTLEWLKELNCDCNGDPLRVCLLTTDSGIVKVPWSEIATPEFINKARTELISPLNFPSVENEVLDSGDFKRTQPTLQSSNALSSSVHVPCCCTSNKITMACAQNQCHFIKADQSVSVVKPIGLVTPSTSDRVTQNLEGDYVDLLEFTKRNSTNGLTSASVGRMFTDLIPPNKQKSKPSPESVPSTVPNGDGSLVEDSVQWPCEGTQKSTEDLCTPCMRRKFAKDPKFQEIRCRYRESYKAALLNPVDLDAGIMTAILEEPEELRDSFALTDEVTDIPNNPTYCRRESKDQLFSVSQSSENKMPEEVAESEETSITQTPVKDNFQNSSIPQESPVSSDCKSSTTIGSLITENKAMCQKDQGLATTAEDGITLKMISFVNSKKISSVSCGSNKTTKHKIAEKGKEPNYEAGTEPSLLPTVAVENISQVPTTSLPPGEQNLSENKAQKVILKLKDLNPNLLQSGVACLPGSRDKVGRAVVQVITDHNIWTQVEYIEKELRMLLLYFYMVPRKEVRDQGLSVIVDARRRLPPPTLFKALLMVQESSLHPIRIVLIVIDKEMSFKQEKLPGIQVEVLTSLKALNKFVESGQLTRDLEGTFPYCHTAWVQFCMKIDTFVEDLMEASTLLHNSIKKLESARPLNSAEDILHCQNEYKEMMQSVLADTRLVGLQRESGSIVARLKKEEPRFCSSEDYRDTMALVTRLADQVEEGVHTLVTKSNQCFQHLDFLRELRPLEDEFQKFNKWLDEEGETNLRVTPLVEESLEIAEQTEQTFSRFFIQASEQYNKGLELLEKSSKISSAPYPEAEVFNIIKDTFEMKLTSFYTQAETLRTKLQTMVKVLKFCEEATWLAVDCQHYLSHLNTCSNKAHEADSLKCMESYQQKLCTEFSRDKFQEVKVQVYAVSSSKGINVWNETWLECQETKKLLEEKLERYRDSQNAAKTSGGYEESLLNAESKLPKESAPTSDSECNADCAISEKKGDGRISAAVSCLSSGVNPESVAVTDTPKTGSSVCDKDQKCQHGREACSGDSFQGLRSREEVSLKTRAVALEQTGKGATAFSPKSDMIVSESPIKGPSLVQACSSSVTDWLSRVHFNRSHSDGSRCRSSHSDPTGFSCRHFQGLSSAKMMEMAQRYQLSRHESFCTEGMGLQQPWEQSAHFARPKLLAQYLSPQMNRKQKRLLVKTAANKSDGGTMVDLVKLKLVLEELLTTERDYVHSLGYVITHYFPEMEKPDLPHGLRGQRGTIFGNLEKLYEFHSQLFLKELEACIEKPLHVGRCFLKQKEHFGLYALYSKNKPQSDALLLNHGSAFFQHKQLELVDKMNLASYLLKPIQRISKYSLLLKDMIRECGTASNEILTELQAAHDVVQFQLRHGNDLLAMDDIQNCDVNLKEQGQLIRQDEFLVSFRKKKCFRHLFLFQELILFSKTKKTSVGNDVYVYKQSFKTSEIGMTHNSGVNGLGFEIWFRRQKSDDTYIIQAPSQEVKDAWTRDLEWILWTQALRNREMRIQERVLMGIGNKPFMDIQPSEAAISDRAINYSLLGKEYKPKPALADSSSHESLCSQRPNSTGSGTSTSSFTSLSSSSSGLGSLGSPAFASSPCFQMGLPGIHRCLYSAHSCIEEDEVENDAEMQMFILDSSESSGESVSGFSSSEPSCLSLILGDADETSSTTSVLCRHPQNQHHSPSFAPVSKHMDSGVVPKADIGQEPSTQPLVKSQDGGVPLRRSTDV
ncbi:uncharacterized protein KIAA1755 homolog [Protopterus annectens]|uniref:uncharacterized protein KIAA1755 homolog n=1 Tax=Protopterus annectens TaxID=7888 RepID=UPI001CFA6746|nr:uncharacterized protein KIAA1755 homolog [Protopterus annectens]